VNWAYFYKFKGDKKEEYQEDKGKFYKAIEQINESIIAIHDYLVPQKKISTDGGYHRVIPIVVTNATICLMEIDDSKVTISTIPWVIYINNFKIDRTKINNPATRIDDRDFQYIHVVSYNYLNDFMNIIIDVNSTFESYPGNSCKQVHVFDT